MVSLRAETAAITYNLLFFLLSFLFLFFVDVGFFVILIFNKTLNVNIHETNLFGVKNTHYFLKEIKVHSTSTC